MQWLKVGTLLLEFLSSNLIFVALGKLFHPSLSDFFHLQSVVEVPTSYSFMSIK